MGETPQDRAFKSFSSFLAENIATDRGEFSFAGYEPLEHICREVVGEAEQVDILKPTQRGFTTVLGFGFGLWQMVEWKRNVGYFLPTNQMASGILKSRFHPATEAARERYELETSVTRGMVEAGGRRMLWLGLETVRNAISWPMDVSLYDEVDDLDQENLTIARQRLDASDFGHEVAFACGRYPGQGIHARYLGGDQRRWVVPCKSCGLKQFLEDHFPDNVQRGEEGWRIVCTRCGSALDVSRGGFVPTRTEGVPEGRVSFQVSALAFGSTDLGRLMRLWDEAKDSPRERAAFRCSKLALPDAGDRQAVTAETLSRALRPRPVADPPFFAGVDVGDRCHIAVCGVARPTSCDALQFVHFASVRGEELPAALHALDRTFDFAGVLIDQKPEGSLARRVCREFPDRAALQEFTEGRTGEDVKDLDGETFQRIAMPREDSVGSLCDQIARGAALFPESWEGGPFAESLPGQHIMTGSQRVEQADRHGLTVLRFRSGAVENHYLMACVFAAGMARRQMARLGDVRYARVSDQELTTAEICRRVGSTGRYEGYDE